MTMMLNAAGLGFLGPEHLAQCCAPEPAVPTWFAAAHEAAGRAEAAAVAQAEAFLAQRSAVALYDRLAPDPLGVPARRGRAEPADGALPARRGPAADSDGDGDDAGVTRAELEADLAYARAQARAAEQMRAAADPRAVCWTGREGEAPVLAPAPASPAP